MQQTQSGFLGVYIRGENEDNYREKDGCGAAPEDEEALLHLKKQRYFLHLSFPEFPEFGRTPESCDDENTSISKGCISSNL